MAARVCVCTLLITIVTGAPDSPATWTRSQPQQTLHGLMVSIDERLHTLENSRWDTTLKQVEQRLDTLETTIRRLDTAFQDRLDKLERNLNSNELKEELALEKVSHKVRDILDSSYDRYNRRLGYTEERLEMSLKKVQMSVEGSLNRIEKQQEDIQTDLVEAVTILEDLKSHSSTTDDKLNTTHKAIQQHIQTLLTPNHEELQRISGSLEHLGSRLNSSSLGMWGSQNDGPPVGDVILSIRNEINTEGTKFTNKVNNMYNDLWRRVISLESLVKDVGRLSNTTQREVLEELRSLVLTDRRDYAGDSQENFLEVALDALERKLQRKLLDLGRKLEDRLDTLSATQNLVMDSCFDGGICRGLESRLSQVLERIFEVYSGKIEGFSNKTFDLDSLVLEMMELVKTQHSQLIRTVSHNTNMVVTLTKDTSDANKLIHNSISQLAGKTESNFQDFYSKFQEIQIIRGKISTNNSKIKEETSDQQKPMENIVNNVTVTNDITPNSTQPTNSILEKHHDEGVLKITTDDIGVLADNSTLTRPGPTMVKLNTTLVVDTSLMQVMGMISPNLTQSQLDSLLQFLNSSVSIESLEAIIQNTEVELDDEAISEKENSETNDIVSLNNRPTKVEVDFNTTENTIFQLENSGEKENVSDENDDETDQNYITAIGMDSNETETVTKPISGRMLIFDQTKPLEISTELKDQLTSYALLMKIRQGNLNFTELWQMSQNKSMSQEPNKCIQILQNLCFGEEYTKYLKAELKHTAMRNRLILINQAIKDADLYNKIEDICNTLTESVENQNIIEDILSEK